jgi:hypothetical protein
VIQAGAECGDGVGGSLAEGMQDAHHDFARGRALLGRGAEADLPSHHQRTEFAFGEVVLGRHGGVLLAAAAGRTIRPDAGLADLGQRTLSQRPKPGEFFQKRLLLGGDLHLAHAVCILLYIHDLKYKRGREFNSEARQ